MGLFTPADEVNQKVYEHAVTFRNNQPATRLVHETQMALQKPGIDFEDNLGDSVAFDPAEHCDLAPYSKAPTAQHCSIVFPSIRPQEAHPHSNAKVGVVRVPA